MTIPSSSSCRDNVVSKENSNKDKNNNNNTRLFYTLTLDIMFQIFGYLSSRELLRCAILCKDWCELLLDWPQFWITLDTELKLKPMQHQYIKSIVRHQETVHLIETPAVPLFAREYWRLLAEMRQRDTTILEFNEFEFDETVSEKTSSYLQPVLKDTGANLEQLIFKNCDDVPIRQLLVEDWLEPCTNLEQLSIPRSWPWHIDLGHYEVAVPPSSSSSSSSSSTATTEESIGLTRIINQNKYASVSTGQVTPPTITSSPPPAQFLSLLHLHMSVSPSLSHLVPFILQRCPNLESLALDPEDYFLSTSTTIQPAIDHGQVLYAAYESCPNLQWIAMAPCASARMPFYKDTLENEDYLEDGLYGLFLCGRYLRLEHPEKHIYPLLKKNHRTLRSLHLVYDGTPMFWYTLYYLGQLGVPKLREISLNTLDGAGFHTSRCTSTFKIPGIVKDNSNDSKGNDNDDKQHTTATTTTMIFEQVLLQLIKRAPALQNVHLDASGGNLVDELFITEPIFKELAKHRLIRLLVSHCCKQGSLSSFCHTPSTRLEQLICDCGAIKKGSDFRHLLKKAKKLWSLETVHGAHSGQFYDSSFDRARNTVRLRSFFDEEETRSCDCANQKTFTPQDRTFIRETLDMRH